MFPWVSRSRRVGSQQASHTWSLPLTTSRTLWSILSEGRLREQCSPVFQQSSMPGWSDIRHEGKSIHQHFTITLRFFFQVLRISSRLNRSLSDCFNSADCPWSFLYNSLSRLVCNPVHKPKSDSFMCPSLSMRRLSALISLYHANESRC